MKSYRPYLLSVLHKFMLQFRTNIIKVCGCRTYLTRSARTTRSHERQRAFLVPAAASPVSPSSLCCTDDRRRAMQRSFTSRASANASISTRLSLLSTTPVRKPIIRRHSLSCQPSQNIVQFLNKLSLYFFFISFPLFWSHV